MTVHWSYFLTPRIGLCLLFYYYPVMLIAQGTPKRTMHKIIGQWSSVWVKWFMCLKEEVKRAGGAGRCLENGNFSSWFTYSQSSPT